MNSSGLPNHKIILKVGVLADVSFVTAMLATNDVF